MKLNIDTTEKTITVEESVIFGELVQTLEKLFPDGEWKEYKMVINITYINPIIVEKRYPINPFPFYPTVPYYPNNPISPLFQPTCGTKTSLSDYFQN